MIDRIRIVDRDQWLSLRKLDVTASVIGALFGLHPYETAMGLYAAKTGVEMPDDENAAAKRRGRLLEGAVCAAVAEERPQWSITKADEYLRDGEFNLGATPDYYVTDENGCRVCLQAKTVAPSAFKRHWTEETPPTWIALQCATEVMLDNADHGVIAALVVDGWHFDLHLYDVPRNAGAEARIREAVAEFWSNTRAGLPPKMDFERDSRLLPVLYPREVPGKVIDLRTDNRIGELLDMREALKATLVSAETSKDAVETEIKAKLGDAEAALVRGWRVTFKLQHRKEHVVKATAFRALRCTREASAI